MNEHSSRASQATALATIQSLDPVYVDAPVSSSTLLDMRAAMESGRMVSAKGWRHLGLTPPPRQAQAADLFDAGGGDV